MKEVNGVDRMVFSQWVHGYQTAYSAWVEAGSGPVSKSDPVDALAWVDNYCRDNPLESVSTAAGKLIYAIKAK